jgi:hypothetical protein
MLFSSSLCKSPLYKACENDNIEEVEKLLKNEKLDVNIGAREIRIVNERVWDKFYKSWERTQVTKITTESPLYLAVEKQNSKLVALLMKHPRINKNIGMVYQESYALDKTRNVTPSLGPITKSHRPIDLAYEIPAGLYGIRDMLNENTCTLKAKL